MNAFFNDDCLCLLIRGNVAFKRCQELVQCLKKGIFQQFYVYIFFISFSFHTFMKSLPSSVASRRSPTRSSDGILIFVFTSIAIFSFDFEADLERVQDRLQLRRLERLCRRLDRLCRRLDRLYRRLDRDEDRR